eukprot:6645460-Prymnesium_polylepis.1
MRHIWVFCGTWPLYLDCRRPPGSTSNVTRLDSTVLTARRQRTGTTVGVDTSPHTHNPSRLTRSHTHTKDSMPPGWTRKP